jgi:hypothetical protein
MQYGSQRIWVQTGQGYSQFKEIKTDSRILVQFAIGTQYNATLILVIGGLPQVTVIPNAEFTEVRMLV